MRCHPIRITVSHLVALALTCLTVSCPRSDQKKNPSTADLLEQFRNEEVFWRQIEVAERLVALQDSGVLEGLAIWLSHEDRHLRGNAAFVFAGLGDPRGFDTICAILTDRSERPPGAIPGGKWSLSAQIRSDRYYAVHLLGQLKDPRAVPILIPLLRDEEVNYTVPWALGEICDRRAVGPLIETLDDKNPSIRVLAIYALQKLQAKESLPRLHALLDDNEKSNFGDLVSVADAAKSAIAEMEVRP